jgi:ABC-type uncharacterized transport system permease subunit
MGIGSSRPRFDNGSYRGAPTGIGGQQTKYQYQHPWTPNDTTTNVPGFLQVCAVKICSEDLSTVLIPLFVFVAFDAELDQAVNQFGIGHARCHPHLRIHADGSEAGHGVDLVDEYPP